MYSLHISTLALPQMVTYRQISSPPDASPYAHLLENFAVFDYVVCPRGFKKHVRVICAVLAATLPWFHRRFPLEANVTLPALVPKPSPVRTPTLMCDTRQLKQGLSLAIQKQLDVSFSQSTPRPVPEHQIPSLSLSKEI